MRATDAEVAGTLSRARYAALSAWLEGLPADLVVMRWLETAETEHVPTPRTAGALLDTLLAGARHRARQHDRSSLAHALTPVRWTRKSRRCAIDALRRLEAMGTPTPQPWHDIGLWLSPRTGICLAAAGVHRFDELIGLCNRYGRAWFRHVPGLGAVGAGRIGVFLCRHASAFPGWDARTIQACAPPPARLGSSRGVPAADVGDPFAAVTLALMRSAPPDALASVGSAKQSARSRSIVCDPRDDDAIQRWLGQWRGNSATRRAYAKEVARFATWLCIEQGKVLSTTVPSDCVAYLAFLSSLSPDSKWCGPRVPRVLWNGDTWAANPAWRPFTGTLSARSQTFSRCILQLLFAWLVRQHHVAVNPWDDIRHVPLDAEQDLPVVDIPHRFWERLFLWLDREACGGPRGRLWRAALLLLAETGLSCEDAAVASANDLPFAGHAASSASVPRELVVLRQDRPMRPLPISPRLFAALRAHWEDRDDSPCYAIGYPRGTCAPKKPRRGGTTLPSHYSARGLRLLVERALCAFSSSLPYDQRDLGRWAVRVRPGNLSHGTVALAVPERLRDKEGPLRIAVRHRQRTDWQERRTSTRKTAP